MKTIQKEGLYKLLLWMSGIALMFMVMASRKSALYACIGMIVIWTILMWKTVVGSKVIAYVGQAVRVRYVVASFLCCSAFGLNFYERWRYRELRILVVSATILDIIFTTLIVSVIFTYALETVTREIKNIQLSEVEVQGGGYLFA